jgi:hypothetical protein
MRHPITIRRRKLGRMLLTLAVATLPVSAALAQAGFPSKPPRWPGNWGSRSTSSRAPAPAATWRRARWRVHRPTATR